MSEREVLVEAPSGRLRRVRQATGLAPVQHRNWWVASGIFLQLIAVAGPVAWVAVRAKHEAVGGVALRATVLIAAHELLHSSIGPAILAGSAVLFAVGSVLLARPFVRSLGVLVVAIPIAAIVGVLVLGVLALVVALVVALVFWGGDLSIGGGGGSRKKKPAEKPAK